MEAVAADFPFERVAYVHVAGGVERNGVCHDTHAHALWPALDDLIAATAWRGTLPGVLLERDTPKPNTSALHGELDRVARAWARGTAPGRRCLDDHVRIGDPAGALLASQSTGPDLGSRQHALARALRHGDACPPGFAADRIATASAALTRKRELTPGTASRIRRSWGR